MTDETTFDRVTRTMRERRVTLLDVKKARVAVRLPEGVRWDSPEAKVWPLDHQVYPSWLDHDRAARTEWCRLTPAQMRTIAVLVRGILEHDGLGNAEYEFKSLEIEFDLQTNCVMLRTVVGHIGDEGTWAEVLCRPRRSIHIGKRGGCTLFNAARYVKGADGKLNKVRMQPQHGISNCLINITE